ncbi:hypothetical protein LOTGIDRAFT_171984 [Lottia gigantea]|uniref:Protein kinase domain-containing protein n=1 Tax=Lottia gigantea TaxID=225164 RepID=V4AY69_LOTGI|nr:hypothetical protein LOTGIDRAFT_171984 [Lottia gigantea]ESP02513.1 hypothetical protein LOTGIDRAFT_171984 [Lottia gigantea]
MLHTRYNIQIDTHQTTSHLYRERIGSGSSCDVYLGFEKGTGKIRALKILKDRSWDRELMKEAESLLKLKRHPNIIEYYGKDKDLRTKQSCLVIEYCSGGSLHTFLKEVPNIHGLPDSEFLILLDHITSGLEHLRQHNCIHRDIKPGNILRHVTSDKRTIYKLSDFGASRMMRNCDEEFMSLAGTEEYLHPAMYEKAFVNRKSSATFNHNADLWSLGCTLFQAVTGAMPFVPFDGARNNRITMYEMIACKPHGAISGSQTSSDSYISWNCSLPADSNMTRSLQKYILRILVGLLEADTSKQWSFVLYKNTVSAILKMKYMVVLNCDDKAVHEFYLNPTSRTIIQHKNYRIEKKYQPWFEIYRQIRSLFDITKSKFEGSLKNGMKSVFENMNVFEFYDRLKSVKTRIENTGHEKLSFQMPEELDNDWFKLTNAIFDRSQELLHRIQGRKKSILDEYETSLHQADK